MTDVAGPQDPAMPQRTAANPEVSAWVAASENLSARPSGSGWSGAPVSLRLHRSVSTPSMQRMRGRTAS